MTREARGVTVPSWRGGEFISLVSVLRAIEDSLEDDDLWNLGDAEFAPGWEGSAELAELTHGGTLVPTRLLELLVSDGIQLVDGEVRCQRGALAETVVSLKSVRGEAWDVFAAPELLDSVRQRFEHVEDLPQL